MSKMFVVRLILFFCLAVGVFGQTPTTAPTASTESPTTKDPTPTTTKDTAATPTTKDTAATPTTKDTAATPTTNDTAATSTTKDTAATPTTKDTAATPTTKDTAATPTTNGTAATPTTKDPAATPTTKDPTATPTTKDTAATPTTKDPSATPTTKDPAATPTTKDTAATPTTKDPATTTTTKDPATTTTPNPCDSNPCNGGSSCQPGYASHFTCLCIAGQTYSEASGLCEEAKVFPGSLTLTNLLFKEEMINSASKQFNETAATFIELMEKVFENHIGYIDSTVLKLRMSEGSARTFWSRESAGVSATMENNFKLNSIIDETIIKGMIDKAIQDCQKGGGDCLNADFKNAKYKEAKQCESSRKPCEDTSTICNSEGGRPQCTCRTGYVKTEYSIRTCKACESGKEEDGVCNDCSFGYSGFNCSESWKLILVIVGTVLGALLLVTLILLPVVARKTPKKSSSKKSSKNAEVPTYTSPYPAKDFRASALTNGGVTNASSGFAGVPKIPRAMPNNNSSWDRGSNLEMTESGSRQALVTRGDKGGIGGYQNPDDTRSFNTRNPYQSRGQGSNPYQSRGQGSNPYQSGGQGSNPYQSGGQGSNPYQSGGQGNNPYQRGGQGSNPYQSGSQSSNPYQSRPQDDNPYQSQGQDNPYFTHDNGRRN